MKAVKNVPKPALNHYLLVDVVHLNGNLIRSDQIESNNTTKVHKMCLCAVVNIRAKPIMIQRSRHKNPFTNRVVNQIGADALIVVFESVEFATRIPRTVYVTLLVNCVLIVLINYDCVFNE